MIALRSGRMMVIIEAWFEMVTSTLILVIIATDRSNDSYVKTQG